MCVCVCVLCNTFYVLEILKKIINVIMKLNLEVNQIMIFIK